MKTFAQFLSEARVDLDKDALARYAAMKTKEGTPMYQLLHPTDPKVVSKGETVDYYVDGNKVNGTIVSIDAKSGIVKIKNSKTKEVDEIQGYPKSSVKR